MNENDSPAASSSAIQAVIYWSVVGVPLVWGVWKTLLKLPALFQ